LQRVRDETHRFATTQNQKLRSKENIVSRFEKLPNIGKKRAKLIYKTWKTLSAFAEICKSAPEEVSETLAMPLSKVEEARLGAEILLKEAAEKQKTAKAAGVTGMVRPHREESLFSEMAGASLQGGGFHSGGAGLPEMAGTEKRVDSPQNASFGTDEVSSENSYLSSLATTALDAPLEAAEPEPEYQ
jgi:excinuclease ABC subunit C